MGVFSVLPAASHGSPAVSPLPTPRASPQLRPVASQGRGYQFPSYQLPSSRGKMVSARSAKDMATTKVTKIPTAPSKTTAPLFPDEIMPNLYISDLETASAVLSPNYASPGRPKIKYVLSLLECAADQPKVIDVSTSANFVLKLIVVPDWVDTNLVEYLPEARDFIRQGLEANDGGVLVHCRKGVSRSGSVMIAYVMECLGLEYEAALLHVQKVRSKVYPNIGFANQLKLWRSLDYSLVDASGNENDVYTQWKKVTKLRKPLNI